MSTEKETTDSKLTKLREVYSKACPDLKKVMELIFEKKSLLPDVTERINGWEDMLAETGRPDVPEFHELPEDLRQFFKSIYKNVVMVEAYNEGESMNIYDMSKKRYYPYFSTNGSPSSFAFHDSCYDYGGASAGSGSRLALKDRKLSDHIGKKHADICREMLES